MRIVSAIDYLLRDEHVLATEPRLQPDLPDVWRKRINAFTGRALSAAALSDQQNARIGYQRVMGQGVSPGPVRGLDAATVKVEALPEEEIAEDAVLIYPGFGLCASGEDITLATLRQVRLLDLPVFLPVAWRNAIFPGAEKIEVSADAEPLGITGAPHLSGLLARCLVPSLRQLIKQPSTGVTLPLAAVLVASPITFEASARGDAADPCARDPRNDPYDDLRLTDGVRFCLYLWPDEVRKKEGQDGPDYGLPASGPAFRNELAHKIFSIERGFLFGDAHPWERLGIPLGLIGFMPNWRVGFFDRHAVVRAGGEAKLRSPLVRQAGSPFLWQARLSQFCEHLADLDAAQVKAERLPLHLRRLPPVGLLPGDVFHPETLEQAFFPAGFDVHAVPVPLEQVEVAVRESGSLRPLDLAEPDAVELMIPVPERLYDPDLLVRAKVDSTFDKEIAKFKNDRTHWLARREAARRRRDALGEAMTGQAPSYVERDAEETTGERAEPLGLSRVSDVKPGSISFAKAKSTLTLDPTDRLFFWIKRSFSISSFSVRLTSEQPDGLADFEAAWGDNTSPPMPGADRWVKLVIPASRFLKANALTPTPVGVAVSGMKFSVSVIIFPAEGSGEKLSFLLASAGKIDAEGRETVYVGDALPAGAVTHVNDAEAAWPWTDAKLGRDEEDFGTALDGNERAVPGLKAFIGRHATSAFLAGDLGLIAEQGLDGFITTIEARGKVTNDWIDTGFIRTRADIYRVRQFMLGADAASQLVTSPALADIVTRDEGARVTGDKIRDFLKGAFETPAGRDTADPTKPAEPPPVTTDPPIVIFPDLPPINIFVPPPRDDIFVRPDILQPGGGFGGFVRPRPRQRPFDLRNRIREETVGDSASPIVEEAAPSMSATAAFDFAGGFNLPGVQSFASETFGNAAALDAGISLMGRAEAVKGVKLTPDDVQAQAPLPGFTERTLSVAERLKEPPATAAHRYALLGKSALIETLGKHGGAQSGLGLSIGDIVVPGIEAEAGAAPVTFKDIADGTKIKDRDLAVEGTRRNEADYFSAAVGAIDNTVSLLRLIEGRVAIYSAVLADARNVRAELQDWIGKSDERLRAIEVEIAEARHDVSVAQALLAEETERVRALNERRAKILREHAKILIFRRPRTVNRVTALPTAKASPVFIEPVELRCRREHPDAPPEIRKMADGFRAAPVAWFPALANLAQFFDRREALETAFLHVKTLAARRLATIETAPIFAAPKFHMAVWKNLAAQASLNANWRHAALALDPARIDIEGLVASQIWFQRVALLGDLIDAGHGRPDASKRASEELERLADAAACLHASFAEVAPVTRLGWAELLSQFDAPVSLRSLTALKDWQSLDIELRREQQGFVDFLHSRVEQTNANAVAAIDRLIQVALLMAAHAPVGQLLAARLVRPAPARPDVFLDLHVDFSAVRIGMGVAVQVVPGKVLARGVVEDIVNGKARARILESADHHAIIDETAIVHLSEGRRFKMPVMPLKFG